MESVVLVTLIFGLRVLPPEGHARVVTSGGPRDPGQPVPVRSGKESGR